MKLLQERVAAAMTDYATKLQLAGVRLDAVLALGDNFYGPLKSEDDKRFADRFENLYPKPALDSPFYFALGNHDYEDDKHVKDPAKKNWKHELAYARAHPDGRWRFPAVGDATWYRLDFPSGQQPLLSIILLDTNTDHVKERWEGQIAWMKQELADCQKSRWRMVAAHHPMFTDGYHFDGKKDPHLYPKIRETILPELGSATFYLSAHDHNQQHIRHPGHKHLDFLLSGAGGGDFIQKRRRPEGDAPWTNRFMESYGFLHLRFSEAEATAQFIGVTDKGWELLGQPVRRT